MRTSFIWTSSQMCIQVTCGPNIGIRVGMLGESKILETPLEPLRRFGAPM